jgi:hypothetical protein
MLEIAAPNLSEFFVLFSFCLSAPLILLAGNVGNSLLPSERLGELKEACYF